MPLLIERYSDAPEFGLMDRHAVQPAQLHFVLDGETFPEKRSPALVCWSRIACGRTAIQLAFPLERDGV